MFDTQWRLVAWNPRLPDLLGAEGAEIRYAINHSDKEIIVVEAALYDDEHNAMFDEIWYVYTSVENRIKRLMARPQSADRIVS